MVKDNMSEALKSQPLAVAAYWQRSASSWMKANERLMRGFVEVLHREMELAQELQELAPVRVPVDTENPLVPDYASQAQKTFKAYELIATAGREIVEELTRSGIEASRTLLEDIASASQEAARDTTATVTRGAEKVVGTLLKETQPT